MNEDGGGVRENHCSKRFFYWTRNGLCVAEPARLTPPARPPYLPAMSLRLSVIIPGHNRADLIPRLMESYRSQSLETDRFDICFVDDGSTDDTGAAVQSEIDRGGLDLRYERIDGRGPAAARNRGLAVTSGEIVYFAGDDFLPEPDNLRLHLDFHDKPDEQRALVGVTTSPEEWREDKFFRWLGHRGLIYDERVYYEIQDPGRCQWNYFHTNNLSLSRDWLREDRFDESYREPCLEDTELGFRLMKKGLVIAHEPRARGIHIHQYDWGSLVRNMRRIGRVSVQMLRQHPDYAGEAREFEAVHAPGLRVTLRECWRQVRRGEMPVESVWAWRAGRAYHRGFRESLDDPGERRRLLRGRGGGGN